MSTSGSQSSTIIFPHNLTQYLSYQELYQCHVSLTSFICKHKLREQTIFCFKPTFALHYHNIKNAEFIYIKILNQI